MSSIKGVTVLPFSQAPKRLYHRTNERGMNGILQSGMVSGAAKSDRSHNYLSASVSTTRATRVGCGRPSPSR